MNDAVPEPLARTIPTARVTPRRVSLAWLVPLAALSAMVVAGTWLGSQLLEKVSERQFVILYRVVLTSIALRLVLVEAAALLPAG